MVSNKRKRYMSEYMKKYRNEHPEHRDYKKFYMLKYKFGITKEEFFKLLNKQKNRCAICGNELDLFRKTHIDHCHETKMVRGILCLHCNTLIGHSKENIKTLESAIKYLEKHIKDKQLKEELCVEKN